MLLKKPKVYCLGANHKSAPVSFREFLYTNPDELKGILADLAACHGFKEIIVLSTCNRFEIYALSTEKEHCEDDVYDAYMSLQEKVGKEQKEPAEYRKYTYYYEGLHAIEHVFAVAASLDSLVIGETQITGQFKEALSLAGHAKTLGSYLDRMAQEVLSTAKQVRSRTKIGEKKVSISHAAIDLAQKVFRDLGEHSFLMIGAGEMAQVAARYACQYNPKGLHVVNRTFSKASELVDTLGVGQAHRWEELSTLLEQVDIVISSTAAYHPIIDYAMLKKIMRKRRGKTLFLVDIAIPRDIDARCGNLDDVYLFEIDDLQKVVDNNLEERRKAADLGRTIVRRGAKIFDQWLSTVAIKPIFANFRDYLDDLMKRELEKTLGRSLFKDLSEQQQQAIENMLSSLAGKMVGDAARSINNPDDTVFREQLASSLRMLFPRKVSEDDGSNTNDHQADKKDEDECKNKIIRI
ncbi:MAG: glutamyl-tRNA reductase [Oligoflexales bacterium]|nr:glutamyl-tRNA reductase [Oligoflexales bacterium]